MVGRPRIKRRIRHRRLLDRLRYCPQTGVWTWKNVCEGGGRRKPGDRAGQIITKVGRVIGVDQVVYKSSILAWFFMTGSWPRQQVDHKNTNILDDRWENLRLATQSQNQANRHGYGRAGFKGVSKIGKKFAAYITYNKKQRYLGIFPTPEAAHAAYCKAAFALHKEFARVS